MSRPQLAEYVNAGWALVSIPRGRKGPISKDWQLSRGHCITDPEIAEQLDDNVGIAHAYSGTCCLDIDDMEQSRAWLSERGVDLDALWNAPDAVRISSGRPNRGKLLYRAPPRPSKKIIMDKQNVLDFRCGSRGGLTVQDVLPPSIHPDTRRPYTWEYGDPDFGHFSSPPELPPEVGAIWDSLLEPSIPDSQEPSATVPGHNLGRAREMLFLHDPDCDRDAWVRCGMALHHETAGGLDGLDLWDEWSKQGSKYKGRQDLETVWRSFNSSGNSVVTISSLRVDTVAEVDEFAIITDDMVKAAALPAPRTPEALKEALNSLRRDKTGRVFPVLPNLMPILSLPEICGQRLAYDSFKDSLVCAPYGSETWRPIRDTDYTATRLWLEHAANFYPVSKDMVRDTIYYVAEMNKMDTAQQWLTSLKWDGVKRVREFMPRYMGTIATPYEYAVGEYLWTALAGRVLEPGCQVDMAVILVGDQGVGKSRGVQAMVPDPEFYAEIRLDEPDESIARKLRGVLVGELAELRGITGQNAALDRIKAFITRSHEKWVPKYQEFATTFARRVVFIGTTNEQEFLVDSENRRWLPVRTSGVDVEAIKRDCEQLWAEGAHLWMEHGVFWRDAQTLAKVEQQEFKVVDNWESVVEQWIKDHESPVTELKVNDVLVQAVNLDVRHITRAQEARVVRILRELGWVQQVLRDKATKKTYRAWIKK